MYPIKVSENHRYFVDQQGEPVFWLGTTQWQLLREYKLEEARLIIEKSKARGFAFAQVMLLGVGDGTKPNVYGQKPWIDDNPLIPNEGYFTNVDAVVRIARQNNLVISMTMFHQRYRKFITLQNARAWAKWIAHRYQDAPTLVWPMNSDGFDEVVAQALVADLERAPGVGGKIESPHVAAHVEHVFGCGADQTRRTESTRRRLDWPAARRGRGLRG